MAVRPAAARGGDGMLYGLITFAALSVLGIGAFIWQLTANKEFADKAAAAQERVRALGTPPGYYSDEATARGTGAIDVMNQDLRDLAQLITGKADNVRVAIQADANRLLARIAEASPGTINANDTLLTALDRLHAAYKQMEQLKQQLENQVTELRSENETLAQGNSLARKEFEDQVAALKADVERIETEKNQALEAKDAQLAAIQATSDASTEELNRSRVERQRLDRERDISFEQQKNLITDLQRKILDLKGSGFDKRDIMTKADGQILRAIPGSDVVYINRGAKDRIRPGMTFEVFSPTGERSEQLRGKASIEVATVMDSTSECRVVRPQTGHLIIEGDSIVNVAYDRDHKTRFVIRGDFDLNYDGEKDWDGTEKVSAIIREWGGQVVDDVDETIDFVVIGQGPQSPAVLEGRTPSAVVQDLVGTRREERAKWQEAVDKANALYIPVLTQTQFLFLTGYSPGGIYTQRSSQLTGP